MRGNTFYCIHAVCCATARVRRGVEPTTGAEKSRDMTIYRIRSTVGQTEREIRPGGGAEAPSILVLFFPSPCESPAPLLSPSFLHLRSRLNDSHSIPSHSTTLSYRPPTGYDMPCVRFFCLTFLVDAISRLWGLVHSFSSKQPTKRSHYMSR
jgi:hypothetical protein